MSVFRTDNTYLYLDISYCEFYIPMYYFDTTKKFAIDKNETIEVLGIFDVGIFKNGKLEYMKLMNLPTMITINVYDSEVRDVVLQNGNTVQCKVIKYLKDAKIMLSSIIQDDEYSKKYLQFITGGKVPEVIPYSKSLQIWRKNQQLNGVHFGVSSTYLELVLSVMHRNPSDLSQKFSKIASDDAVSDYGYKFASIRQICQYNSTFTALTFEDIDSMITTSLNKSKNKSKDKVSPVEQVIKF